MWHDARLVAGKDLRIELRTKVLTWQVLPFAVLALVLFALALGPDSLALRRGAPGVFWLALLFVSVFATARSAGIETAEGTRTSVRLLGLDPAGVFLGKTLALFVELLVISLVLALGSVIGFHVDASRMAVAIPVTLAAVAALAAVGTLYGALVAGIDVASTLLPLLVLPALTPVLIAGERATAEILAGGGPGRWAVILVVMAAVYLAIGTVLYGSIEESA